MIRIFRYFLVFATLFLALGTVSAQVAQSMRGQHKVKKKETVFGIARMYDLTVEELIKANPVMNTPGFELKKGDIINVPWPSNKPSAVQPDPTPQTAQPAKHEEKANSSDFRKRPIRLGVMLPLHDINGDGRRMVEYYRGVLMACDSLKKIGISVDVRAWNTPDDGDIRTVLLDKHAADRDLIIGPLYSKQMDAISEFVDKHNIQLVIPFSISAPQLSSNHHIFQVWQSPADVNDASINRFLARFKDYHPVFIDCNDSTSRKGNFTSGLRRQLEQRGIAYSLTNLKSGEDNFSKSFSRTKRNVVILNTGRMQELGVAFSKINGLKNNNPELNISMFGYTEWLTYTRSHLENFYKYDTYIPSVFFYNPLSASTQRLQQKYRWNFHADMQNTQPRFALTGFDQAYFFLRGLHKYGKSFNGAEGMFGYAPVQTPLKFERYGNGGFRNRTLLFVHYTPEHQVEAIRF